MSKVKVKIILRPTVSRPVRLCVRPPSGTRHQFFFLLESFFRPLRVYYFVAPSLTIGRSCNLLLLLVLASAVPQDSRPYFIVPILETPPTWMTRSPYSYPPGTGWPRYTPGHWVPFPSPLTTRRATKLNEVEVNLRPKVSRPVCLGVRSPSGTFDQFFFLLEIRFRHLRVCYFVAPSRPCQSSHSWVEVPQNSRPYFTVSFETPPTWRTRFPYLYPPGTGWPSYTPGHWVPFMSPLTTRMAAVEVF
jgi:hypothetical protein